jgi:hypothetical protein
LPAPVRELPLLKALRDTARARIKEAKAHQEENLRLDDLFLTDLPDELFELTHLKYLDLESNFLAVLPAGIGKLTGLEDLVVYSNRLNSLPQSMSNLRKLRALEISENRFDSIPAVVFSLHRLKWFFASDNRIVALPGAIGNLKHLTLLKLRNNKIRSIPEELLRASKLKDYAWGSSCFPMEGYAYLGGNPLVEPPKIVIAQGKKAMKSYFAEKKRANLSAAKEHGQKKDTGTIAK